MMLQYWWVPVFIVAGLSAVAIAFKVFKNWKATCRERKLAAARDEFRMKREMLEAKFLTTAGELGSPRGLRWVDCQFDDEITYARDRATGELSALVAVTIRFEAIEGGLMEDVEAVGNLRAATAVFAYDGNQWGSLGRAIFNLNPEETLEHFRESLIMVGQADSSKH